MESVKATLTVVLKANEVVVAEIADPKLWQRVLSAINSGKSELQSERDPQSEKEASDPEGTSSSQPRQEPAGGANLLDNLARQLRIDRATVEGGCSPTKEAPYIRLNAHCWAEMKKNLPQRGPGAVAPIVVAATMLALWFKNAELGTPTQAQARDVLGTIDINDPNASRSIRNATWLQARQSGQFVLNPAEIVRACTLMSCFCSKDWKTWKEAAAS
jgi:hypothetical protein